MKPILIQMWLTTLLLLPVALAQPTSVDILGAPFPIRVLAQSPADTSTELQAICLFRSAPANTLHGSLTEMNEKLKGLLERVRRPELFEGELGETLVITPPEASVGAKRLLIIGLGDSQTFSPQRMQLVGEILYGEASRLAVTHPFFAPTILDGGVSKFTTGEIAEQVIRGLLRAAAIDRFLGDARSSNGRPAMTLTYLAGAKNVSSTQAGIEKAIASANRK